MTLRLRLLLGYGYLVGLLLLAAGSSLLGFLQLSLGVGVVLEENVKSISAAMQMIEAIERQDSATLSALLEERSEAEGMEGHETAFRDALAVALDNITEDEETGVLRQIERDYEAYRRARDELLASPPDRPVAAYERTVTSRFQKAKKGLFHLLDINQQAMVDADRRARQAALTNGAWLGALVTISLISFVVLSRIMQRQVLNRLERLRRGSEEVAATGDVRRRLLEHEDDELGDVAAAVNRLLDRLQQAEGRRPAESRRDRRLVLALLADQGPRAGIVDLEGRLLAGEPGDETEAAVREWAASEGRRIAEAVRDGSGDEVTARVAGGLELRLLRSPADRPLAWLVR